jgi:hypothetical protein
MSSDSLHSLPRYGSVVAEELRAVGIALRREWMLFALGLGFMTLIFTLNEIREGRSTDMRSAFNLTTDLLAPLSLLGLFAPMSVWKAEGPSRRGYHWAMPVGRIRHTVAKTFAGWGWLMLLVTIFLLWAVLLASATGGETGAWSERVAGPGSMSVGQVVRLVYHDLQPWQWIAPYTAMTLTYLFGSILVLASDHPWLWIAGLFVGFFILAATLSAAGLQSGLDSIFAVVFGRYGISSALTGLRPTVETLLVGDRSVQVRQSVPELRGWVVATAVWTIVAAGGFLWAANRHPED